MAYNLKQHLPNIWIKKYINDVGTIKHLFKWYEAGILGCGPDSVPWIDMSEFIQWPTNVEAIKNELQTQLLLAGERPGGGTCMLPENLNGYKFLTHYEYFAEKYIPKDVRNTLRTSQALDAWVQAHLAKPIWECALILKKQPDHTKYWTGKHSPGAEWQDPDTQHGYNYKGVEDGVTGKINGPIPLTKAWIDSLENYLFKHIGRVIVYANKIGHAVPTHRDFPINPSGHSAHFVNIQLTTLTRKSFMYDEITKEKIYTTSRAYMFNESDCHGVDPEEENHFTIRIDGEFQNYICEKLGFINGQVFNMNYKNGYKVTSLKIFEPEDSNEY